jgi:hypothetical protein
MKTTFTPCLSPEPISKTVVPSAVAPIPIRAGGPSTSFQMSAIQPVVPVPIKGGGGWVIPITV